MKSGRLALPAPFEGIELGYLEYGDVGAERTVVCVHGLTRNAHDFDVLARHLAARGARVLAIDMVGRGGSSWLADPSSYVVPTYAAHMHAFLATLKLGRVDWIGTSMGGLIGMTLAAQPGNPIRRLVLNDVGPFVPKAALAGIGLYLGLDLLFPDLRALEAHLRQIHAGFGRLDDASWRAMAERSARRVPEGWRLHYDPAIRAPFVSQETADLDLWPIYDEIRCPTLVLRGNESALLLPETALAMKLRGPRATVITIPEAGHAPALLTRREIEPVTGWLGL